ncbi:Monoglyceride lipase, partial [Araneus ventricosus]
MKHNKRKYYSRQKIRARDLADFHVSYILESENIIFGTMSVCLSVNTITCKSNELKQRFPTCGTRTPGVREGPVGVGHGYSDGSRAYINDVQELVEDSVSHIQMIRKEYPELPLFVCGHSMGGAVTVFLSLQVQISGMVLIAPALAANPETATFFTVTIAKFMSKFFPFCPMAATDFSLSTRNENFINEIKKDKLCFQGYWSARTIVSLLQAAE